MGAATLGLLLAGVLLMLVGGYAYGNATVTELAGLDPAVAAVVRRQRWFYAGCMALAGLGVLLLCAAIGVSVLGGGEPGWLALVGAGAYAAAGAGAAACGALRALG